MKQKIWHHLEGIFVALYLVIYMLVMLVIAIFLGNKRAGKFLAWQIRRIKGIDKVLDNSIL